MTGRAMAARSGETGTGSTEGNSAVANGDGPQTTDNRENIVTTSEQQAVPVAQEDREALIQHWIGKGFPTREVAAEMINGWPDTAPVLQMLARHRLAATSLHDMQITPALSLPCKSGEGAGASGVADEAHRLASVLRIAQAYSNEHGEDMIKAAGMLDRLIYLPALSTPPAASPASPKDKSEDGVGVIPYGSWDTARIKTAIESKLNGLWSWLSSLDGSAVDADEAQKQIALVDGALKNLGDIPDATQTREAEGVEAIAELDIDALASAIHDARWDNGREASSWVPLSEESGAAKVYCLRIANAVQMHLLAALAGSAGQ